MENQFFKIKKLPFDVVLGVISIFLLIIFDFLVYFRFSHLNYVVAFLFSSTIPLFFLLYYVITLQHISLDNFGIFWSKRKDVLVKIIFWTLITLALLLLLLEHLQRSTSFFILVSAAILCLFLRIFYSDISKQINIILFEICFISIFIRIIPLALIPGFYVDDPYFHEGFTVSIIQSQIIPLDSSYSPFPIMHLLLSMSQLITDASFKLTGTIFLTVLQGTLIPIFIFLICKKIFQNNQISLLASLFFAFSDIAIGLSLAGPFPTTYAIILISIIIFLILTKSDLSSKVLIFIFLITLIFSHSLSTLLLGSFLIFMYVILIFAHTLDNTKKIHLTLALIIFFSISFILYWMFVSNFIFESFVRIIFEETTGVKASFSSSGGLSYAQLIPIKEYILELSGKFLYFGLAIVGLLSFLKSYRDSISQLILTIFGLLLFFVGGVGLIFSIGIAPDRILYYSYLFLAIPAAAGAILCLKSFGKYDKILVFVSIFFIFLMITNSVANKDSPIYANDLSAKRYLDISERESIDNFVTYATFPILTDNDLSVYIKNVKKIDSIMIDFSSPKFSKYTDSIIIVRKSFIDYPVYSKGLYRISYDTETTLSNLKFDNIYNSDLLNAYLKN